MWTGPWASYHGDHGEPCPSNVSTALNATATRPRRESTASLYAGLSSGYAPFGSKPGYEYRRSTARSWGPPRRSGPTVQSILRYGSNTASTNGQTAAAFDHSP